VRAEETSWEIRGELVSLKTGSSDVVLLRVAGGQVLEVPLASFSEAQQAEIVKRGGPPATVADAGDASAPTALEVAAEGCRTAVEAADVYQLFLASPGLSDSLREAAEKRLAFWSERGRRGDIRHGTEWVGQERAAAARSEAEGHLRQAIQMIRIGNTDVAEDELRKASRADPASGGADFLLGIAASSGPRPSAEKARKFFREVIDREPGHGPALNNLAICDVIDRRLSPAALSFRSAADHVADPQAVVGNVSHVIRLAADRRNRIAPKHVEEFTALYRWLVDDKGLEPADGAAGLTYLSFTGAPIAAGGVLDPESVMGLRGDGGPERSGTGVVVAPSYVVVPTAVVANRSRITVAGDVAIGQEVPATAVATLGGLTLLRCEGLAAPAIPVAATSPALGAEIVVVYPQMEAGATVAPKSVRATVVARPADGALLPRLVYKAPGDRQPVGGILTDASGRLVGLTARTPAVATIGADLNVAAPMEAVWPMLHEAKVQVEPAAEGSAVDPAELAKSAVRVLVHNED
jgi:Flp pilus assembly protein TadD